MSFTSGSSAEKSGEAWKYLVYFVPNADEIPRSEYHINYQSLIRDMSELIDGSEEIVRVLLYKNPLTDWQLTQFLFNHQFVVLETKSWWWSIEKDDEGIVVQRAKHVENVKNWHRQGPRIQPVAVVTDDQGGEKTMQDFINFLAVNQEQFLTYNWLTEVHCLDNIGAVLHVRWLLDPLSYLKVKCNEIFLNCFYIWKKKLIKLLISIQSQITYRCLHHEI